MSYKNIVPIYPLLGGDYGPPLNPVIVDTPGMVFQDAGTKKILDKPVVWGDIRPDGKPYHGGIYIKGQKKIIFHQR